MSHLFQGWGNTFTFEKALGFPMLFSCSVPLSCDLCLYPSTLVPDTEKEQEWTPVTGPLLALKEEDQLLVRMLSLHVLNGEWSSVWPLGEALRVGQSSGPSIPAPFLCGPLGTYEEGWNLALPLRSGAARGNVMELLRVCTQVAAQPRPRRITALR